MLLKKKHIEHNDPSRCPKLQVPIEEDVISMHKSNMNNILVDVTKELVKIKKN
jgi:hypothetical protein